MRCVVFEWQLTEPLLVSTPSLFVKVVQVTIQPYLVVVMLVRELPKVNKFGLLVGVLKDCCVFFVLPVGLPKTKESIHYYIIEKNNFEELLKGSEV